MSSIENRLAALLEAVAFDVATAGLHLDAGVFDVARERWVVGGEGIPEPQGFSEDELVLVLPGRAQVLERVGSEPAFVELVDAVCDWVMDEVGHGWPELADVDGRFLCLMTPALEDGDLVWRGQDIRVPLGRLQTVPLVSVSSST